LDDRRVDNLRRRGQLWTGPPGVERGLRRVPSWRAIRWQECALGHALGLLLSRIGGLADPQ
jgi:hypothetical protein